MTDVPRLSKGSSDHFRGGASPAVSAFVAWWQDAVNLVFPPRCAGCGRVDTDWCHRCQQETAHNLPILNLHHLSGLDGCAASGRHEGKLQDAVQALKYENARSLAHPFALRLRDCLLTLSWTFDTIIPVPIGTARLKERGYNQAGLIAAALAQEVGVATHPHYIWRDRETRSQVGLNAAERHENVEGAFRADPALAGRSVLLVDDVYTTGATLAACAEAVRTAGALQVYALTVTAAHSQ
ncbi:MAG: ComF family protein [Chloroflexota bacterium]|nr:ComF family protein [Chloroflexota bacterium]